MKNLNKKLRKGIIATSLVGVLLGTTACETNEGGNEAFLGLSLLGLGIQKNSPGAVAVGRGMIDYGVAKAGRTKVEVNVYGNERKRETTLGEAFRNSPEYQKSKLLSEFRRQQIIDGNGIIIYEPYKGDFEKPFYPKEIFEDDDKIAIVTLLKLPLIKSYLYVVVENLDSGRKVDATWYENVQKNVPNGGTVIRGGDITKEDEIYYEVEFKNAKKLKEKTGKGENFKVDIFLLTNPENPLRLLNPLYTKRFMIKSPS